MDQKYTSEKTSRNQIAAGFKKVPWEPGTSNLDIGGGKYEKASKYLYKEHSVVNFVYDPFCRAEEHNCDILNLAPFDTCTLFNVLNVIEEAEVRAELLQLAKNKARLNGHVYIAVYEGDKSKNGKATRDGFQWNCLLSDFTPEITAVFPEAFIKNGVFVCKND